MALFRIPWPWDYHGSGALIVEAPNEEVAVKRARKYMENKASEWKPYSDVQWDKVAKVDGYVAEDYGCDC